MKKAELRRISHLYERLAQTFADRIEDGTLRPGDRVPSVRALSLEQGLSVSTAVQAYVFLENRGYLEARPQSGFYVKPRPLLPSPEPSVPKAVAPATEVTMEGLVARVFAAVGRPDSVPLGAACGDPSLMPHAALSRLLASWARRESSRATGYIFPPGWEPLRRQLARLGVQRGLDLSPGDFLVTVGSMEALCLALRAVARSGDVVAVESPAYFGVLMAAQHLGLKVLEVPSRSETGLDVGALRRALARQRVSAVLASPNFPNPIGALMPDAAKKELVAELTRRKIPLIEDDVYGDLSFAPQRPRPAKAFDTGGWVILCSSFSKTLAPGWRIGWAAGGRFHERLLSLKQTGTVANSSLEQMALAEYLDGGGYERHLRRLRQTYASQLHLAQQAVLDRFPPGTRVSRPKGGHLLWVELPGGTNALRVFDRAAEKKIGIVPGPLFSASGRFRNCFRLNCGVAWSPRVDQALSTLGRIAFDEAERASSRASRRVARG